MVVLYSPLPTQKPAHRTTGEGPPTHMRTSEVFWKLFSTTGSISAYLMYRHLHPAPAN